MKHFLNIIRYVPASLFVLMLLSVQTAHAATSPSLGDAASYSVLSGAVATNGGAGSTTLSGDLGVDPAASYSDLGSTTYLTPGNPHLADTAAHNAQVAQKAVFDGPLDFVQQPCTVTYPATTELSGVGPLDPGVYCTLPGNDFTLSGTLTLHGTGSPATDVWIFRSSRDLIGNDTAKVVFTGTGGYACNVWWRISRTATFTASDAMVGNILAATSITFGQSATLDGRAFAYTGAVTMLGNTISGPTCSAQAPAPGSASVNRAPNINLKKVPNPLSLPNGPGPVTYTYTVTNPGTVTFTNVTLTDDKCTNIQFVSGDTNGNGWMENNETWTYTCTTNLAQTTINYATVRGTDNSMAAVDTATAYVVVGIPVVPPLITIIKTPDPFTLPSQGGSVTYSYTVTNPGTVALTDVTVVDDKCSSVNFVSGDANGDSKLQPNETWKYTCTKNISQTTTNTVVATGHANGLTAIDTALATVVVEGSPIPPLIHIIKSPDPIILPTAGGWVTYTYTVTNPGTEALHDVTVADDKCTGITSVSGDSNGNSLLDTNETWLYTCKKFIAYTTTNTATAQGSANGLTVKDVAVASVTVSPALIPPPVPKLPNTGFNPDTGFVMWLGSFAGIIGVATLLFFVRRKRQS